MGVEQQIDSLLEEYGETCYYRLADRMGILIFSIPDLEDCICGFYEKPLEILRVVVLNSTMASEDQEKAVYRFIVHDLKHRGVPLVITKEMVTSESTLPVTQKSKAYFELKGLIRSLLDATFQSA